MTENLEPKRAQPYRVMAWAIRNIDGTWLHQTKQPGTVDVWMMKDWPWQYTGMMGRDKWRIVPLSVNLEDLTKKGPRKFTKSATWPYTIPESAIEEATQ